MLTSLLLPSVNGPRLADPGFLLFCDLSSVSKLSPLCSRCSRILRANVRNASSMFMFCLHDTSKKGISKFSAIWNTINYNIIGFQFSTQNMLVYYTLSPLAFSTIRWVGWHSHLFPASIFTTSGEAFCLQSRINWVFNCYFVHMNIKRIQQSNTTMDVH